MEADIGNAHVEVFTDEKLEYIVAGPELQELEGYILIFLKALYALQALGLPYCVPNDTQATDYKRKHYTDPQKSNTRNKKKIIKCNQKK